MLSRTPATNRLLLATLMSGFAVVATSARGGVIHEDLKLLAEDGSTYDNLGISIAMDNGIVAGGAWYDGDNGHDSGSAYLFDSITGAQLAKLLPEDGAERNYFGNSIALDDGLVAVGAFGNDSLAGAAYLFDASTGKQLAKILPDVREEYGQFGRSIAIDGGIVGAGAISAWVESPDPGSVYLFDASTGDQLFRLRPSDGEMKDHFGAAVAISDGIVAVGAYRDDDNGTDSGSAYLFSTSTGEQLAKLLPNDGAEGDFFGSSIAIKNGLIAVGASRDDDNGTDSGSVYLFDAITGDQIAKLLPNDGAARNGFGFCVGIDTGFVAVGAPGRDENGPASGAAYLFNASTGAQIAKLLSSDGEAYDQFAYSIAIDGGEVAVGARWDDNDNGGDSGSAYVFHVGNLESCTRDPEWRCDGDVDGDGQVNPVDAGLVQAAFGSLDERALCNYDLDCDGQINPVDSGIVQSLFGTCDPPREVCP
jgi:hypothetical protein